MYLRDVCTYDTTSEISDPADAGWKTTTYSVKCVSKKFLNLLDTDIKMSSEVVDYF